MRFLTLIIGLLFALVLVFNGLRPAEPIDPYEPVPGAYDGLTTKEIEQLEAEREASRMIDQVLVMEATAYTWTGQRTASGTWPAVGTVAVDPEVIPLGTRLWVEGYGEAVALDTGGAIKGNIIDVYMADRERCIQWGRRPVEVRIIDRKGIE